MKTVVSQGTLSPLQYCNCTRSTTMRLTSTYIDSPASLAQPLHALTDPKRSLYVGCKHSHVDGRLTMSILQLFIPHKNHVYLLDVQTLGKTAFTTDIHQETGGTTLRSILESLTIQKVFFDVRAASHLLHTHFGIALRNTQDVQLLESASHSSNARASRFLLGLRACIQREKHTPSRSEKKNWEAVYQAAARLFDPGLGGSVQAFQDRPLAEEIRAYFVQELQYLPLLRAKYWHRHMARGMAESVATETAARLQISCSANFRANDRALAISPFQDPSEVLKTFQPNFDKTKIRAPPHTTVNGLESKDSSIKHSTSQPRPKPPRLIRHFYSTPNAFRKFGFPRRFGSF